LQYFAATAEEGSFSRAARRLDVSVPAITKMIGALERNVGTRLFERTTRGISITMDGREYLESCLPALEQLAAAEESMKAVSNRPRGTLVVGVTPNVAQHALLPALPRFHSRYPDIEIDIRATDRVTDLEPGVADVYVLMGWPQHADLVHRRIALTKLLTCASPDYWASRGIPVHPRELERHTCLFLRNPEGTVIDLWEYERDGSIQSVHAKGWLVSDHRDIILDAAIAGEGVARLSDLTCQVPLQNGQLVPVLPGWAMRGAPPINLLYRPNQRRSPRARVFIEFVTALFRDLESERAGSTPGAAADRPSWHRHRYRRASVAMRGR